MTNNYTKLICYTFKIMIVKLIFPTIIVSLFFTTILKANEIDSALYKKRVAHLKNFSIWLAKEAIDEIAVEGIYYQYDSAANKNWAIFDKAIDLFYNRRMQDSLMNVKRAYPEVFSPEFKARIVKGIISRFSSLSHCIAADSLNFKPQTFSIDFIPSEKDKIDIKNKIIQYFIIDGEIVEYLSFRFEESGSKLIAINVSEPQDEIGKKLAKYLQNLKKY